MKSYQKKILIVGVIVAIILVGRWLGVDKYLTFEMLKENRARLQQVVQDNYLTSVGGYIVIYIVAVALSVPGATILTLAGGFLFGAVWAAIYVNVGATIGATLVFIFARYLVGRWFQQKYQEKMEKFNRELETNGYSYLLTLRFIPIFPFS